MLFKYVSNPDYILEEGYIRATQLSVLNDPFEANYSQEGLKKVSRECECFDDNQLIDYIEEYKHKVGIISFSECKDDLLMWAHYANEHKGALISFGFFNEHTISNLFVPHGTAFTKEYDSFTGKCLPVKYRKQPIYEIDPFDRDYSNISAEGGDRMLFEIFQQKSDEWIYEKEHRITLKLEQADKVIIDDFKQYENEKWFQNIFVNKGYYRGDFFTFENNKLYVFLEKITDDSDRQVSAGILAGLAKDNPNILYLFKLSNLSIQIWSIAYGLKADIKNIKSYSNDCMINRFEKYKVVGDQRYTLKFEEI